MNLKLVCSSLTIATAATAATLMTSSPAQALLVGGSARYNPLLDLPTTLTVEGAFAENDPTNPAFSNRFTGFDNISVAPLNLFDIDPGSNAFGFNAGYGETVGFLSNFLFDGQPAQLTLLPGSAVFHITGTNDDGSFRFATTDDILFSGIIELPGSRTRLASVLGNFGAGETFFIGRRTASFRLNVTGTRVGDDVEVIPTPALVPAALSFGAAMLRRRKGKKDEPETANAEGLNS